MNANELADMLAKSSIRKVSQGEVVVDMFEIADMLRQQQKQLELHKNAHHEAVEICRQQADEITELKLQLAIMEGEYPEPTINEKVKEFKDLAQALAEIEALKDELKLIDELVAGKDESFDRTASHMAGEYVSYNDPAAWINRHGDEGWLAWDEAKGEGWTAEALYTHAHPDNLGLAESIIKQQQAEIEALKEEVKKYEKYIAIGVLEELK